VFVRNDTGETLIYADIDNQLESAGYGGP